RGLLGMQVPEAYGGLGLKHIDALRVLEQLAAIDLTLATVVFLNATTGSRPIQGFATAALREELLPRLASGRELASFARSEPGRGMAVAEDALSAGRLCVATVCLGGLKRCAQLLIRYGSRRTVASGALLANPVVLATLGELAALVDALEALKDQVAARLDSGQ